MQVRQLCCLPVLILATLMAVRSLVAQQPLHPEANRAAPPLAIRLPGQPVVELGGPWQFHLGDNPQWATPGFDDSHWGTITTDRGWDVQGYPDHGGFAWYRRHLQLSAVASPIVPLALLYPTDGNNVYEAFWNGRSLGACGSFPPHERMIVCWKAIALPVGATGDAVLAIRVWAPAGYHLIPPGQEGFTRSPRLGSLPAAQALLDQELYGDWRSERASDVLTVLYAVALLLAIFTSYMNPREPLYRWLALFLLVCTSRSCANLWVDYGSLSWEWDSAFIWLVGYLLQFVSLWLLLLRLFDLDRSPFWVRTTKSMIALSTAATLLMTPLGLILPHWTSATAQFYRVDWCVLTVTELFSLVLIAAGMRLRLDLSRWTVAVAATVAVLSPVIFNIFQLLERWDVADHLTATLQFHLGGGSVGIVEITRFLLLLALAYVAVYTLREARRQHLETELEVRSAQEVQQILIPETLPPIPGYALSSAYRPARDVGGDFFQVIPLGDQSTLLLVGDVSGKGLRAGMMVAFITGSVRAAAEANPDPAALLTSLNRKLHGRLQGGFVTSLALRLFPDGRCLLANAGHLAPMLNGKEVALPGTLPLGLVAAETYESIPLQLLEGNALTLYTDGVPEARNVQGELFGFERTAASIAELGSAEMIAERAQMFGQDDDITVLTLKRMDRTRPAVGLHAAVNAVG